MSWYRTHRPRQVADLHLTSVRETLQVFLDSGKVPQVLLFAGPKGTGKTTSARIIGAILNDPQNAAVVDHLFFQKPAPKSLKLVEASADFDLGEQIFGGNSFVVQEMDAASNRGIDDVRALRERVMLPPQLGKVAVYILDEAHMLTTEAFNALLKLLEEPPPHALFILATTELHKIPSTITSRATLVSFRQASVPELVAALTTVLDKEGLKYEPEAIEGLAVRAEGSFRDGVKLLEQASAQGEVTMTSVEAVIAGSATALVRQLIGAVLEKDAAQVVRLFQELRQTNTEEAYVYRELLTYVHHTLLQGLGLASGKPDFSTAVAQFLLKNLSTLPKASAPIPHLLLELAVLEIIDRAKQKSPSQNTPPPSNSATTNNVKKNPKNTSPHTFEAVDAFEIDTELRAETISSSNLDTVIPLQTASKPETVSSHSGDSQVLIARWSDLLQAVRAKNMTLEALLRSAKPLQGSDGSAQVAVYYKFHKEQLEHPKFRSLISECAATLAGGAVSLEYVLAEPPAHAELVQEADTPNLTALAEEILI